MSKVLLLQKEFIKCLLAATEKCGEVFCAPCGITSFGDSFQTPERPYFSGYLAYTFVDPSQGDRKAWLMYVSYTFDLPKGSAVNWCQRIIDPVTEELGQWAVDWVCGCVVDLKMQKELMDSPFTAESKRIS